MSVADISLTFTNPQLEAYHCLGPGRTVFLGWGRGTGKSHFIRTVCWLRVAEYDGKLRTEALEPFRGIRIAWLMPSRKQFVDVHSAAILEELGGGGKFGFLGAKINKTTWEISFPGGSTLIPFPASDYNSQNARGVRADLVVVDECDDVGTDVYNSVAVPWLSGIWSRREELLAGTPTRGRHGNFYRMLDMGRRGALVRAGKSTEELEATEAEALSSIYASRATYADCPEIVSPQAVAKAKATTPKATFEREWEANPDAGEGLIFPDFDPDFHVRTPPPDISFREFLVGADFGDVDPGVLLRAGVQGGGNDATLWILDEWYETACLNSTWDDRAIAWRGATFYPDPSRQDRIRDWRSKGLDVRDLPPDVKPIAAGIARMADLMFRRKHEKGDWCRFYVSPKCKNLIREFGLYRRKKERDGTFSEEPEGKDDHAIDACRYLTASRFGRVETTRHTTGGR